MRHALQDAITTNDTCSHSDHQHPNRYILRFWLHAVALVICLVLTHRAQAQCSCEESNVSPGECIAWPCKDPDDCTGYNEFPKPGEADCEVVTCDLGMSCSIFQGPPIIDETDEVDCNNDGVDDIIYCRSTEMYCEFMNNCRKEAPTNCDLNSDGVVDCEDLKKFVEQRVDDLHDDFWLCCNVTTKQAVLDAIQAFLEECGDDWCEDTCKTSCASGGCAEYCAEVGSCVFELAEAYGFELTSTDVANIADWAGAGCDDSSIGDPDSSTDPNGNSEGNLSPPIVCDIDLTLPWPVTGFPVDLAAGDKFESGVDIRIPLSGRDFVISRTYRSETGYAAPPLLGEKWTLSVFEHVVETVTGDPATYDLKTGAGTGHHMLPEFSVDSGDFTDGRLHPEGPTTQYLELDSVTEGIYDIAVYRVVEPGGWSKAFYRKKRDGENLAEAVPHLLGLLAETRDPYGNTCTYRYTTTLWKPRLESITLNSNIDTDGQAKVSFLWDVFTGRLGLIQVTRPDSNGDDVLTQEVRYTYMRSFDSSLSDDVGTDGDLIQVERRMRVDPPSGSTDATMRSFITQYRYHTDSVTSGPRSFTWAGTDHQLKMVIAPEQIEYYAQQENTGASTSKSIQTLARELLEKDDGATAYTGDTALVVDLAAKVLETYETTGQRRLLTQYLQTACGCGGGSTQGIRQTNSYAAHASGNSTRIVEEFFNTDLDPDAWDDYRTTYYDMEEYTTEDVPYLVNIAIVDDTGSGREWVTHNVYDTTAAGDRMLTQTFTPAATSTYTPSDFAVSTPSAPSWTGKTSGGLVHWYDYTDDDDEIIDNRVSEFGVQDGSNGTQIKVAKTTYGDADGAGSTWTSTNSREFLVSKAERYRDDVTQTGDDLIEVTEYFYGFHTSGSSSEDIAWRQTRAEAELTGENGPGSTYDAFSLFDDRGNLVWTIDESGTFTKRVYDVHVDAGYYSNTDYNGLDRVDSLTGSVVVIERNSAYPTNDEETDLGLVIPTAAPSTARDSDGGSIVTVMIRDKLGRVQETITPGGVSTYKRCEMRTHPSRPNLDYYAEIVLPHNLDSTSDYKGPATITWYNADNDAIASRDYEIDTGGYSIYKGTTSVGYEPIYKTYDLKDTTSTDHIAASETDHDVSGLVTAHRVWHSVAGIGAGSGKYETTYTYDELGRLEVATNPNGTESENAAYDVLNRVLEVKTGTTTGASVMIAEYVYDGTGMTQGEGNGTITRVRTHEDNSTTRDTDYTYDFRDRLVVVKAPEFPNSAFEYDNLDRVVNSGVFVDLPDDDHNFDAAHTPRKRLTRTYYSQRGLVYRQELAKNPELAAGSDVFATDTWYDEVGRPVAARNISGPDNKTTYDGLGRPITSYLLTWLASDTTYAHKYNSTTHEADVTDDVVFEQTNYEYIDDEGLLELVTAYRRTHDATDSNKGDLKSLITSEEKLVITTFTGTYYDDADRVIRSVNFGTNKTDFRYGGVKPAITQSSPPDHTSSDLVTATSYNARGLPDTMTSPEGDVTKYFYDDLNRTIAMVEQHDNIGASDVTWDGTDGRWHIADVGGASDALDVDRATSFVYDGIGNVIVQTAHQPEATTVGDTDQVTEYIYGVTTTSSPLASDINSKDLLLKAIYPTEEDSGGATEEQRTIHYAYNRLGELIDFEDQNDTKHTYTRDKLGRITKDEVTIPGGSDIDDAIESIEYDYKQFGLLQTVKSLDSSDVVQNAVKFNYSTYWSIEWIKQDNDGDIDVGGSSPLIDYIWSAFDSDDINGFRIRRIIAPGGGTATHKYGADDSSDELAFRVREVGHGSEWVGYDYIGWNMVAEVDYQDPDVQLDYTAAHTGGRQTQGRTDIPGIYPGYDTFGRVAHHMWVDGAFKPNPNTVFFPDIPPLMEFTHTYDKESNRTGLYDARTGATQNLSYEYAYDGLDRLKDAVRGNGAVTASFTAVAGGEQWNLDMLGNWHFTDNQSPTPDVFALTTDTATPYGTFNSSDTEQDRDNNLVNELDDIDGNTLEYDHAGNLRLRYINANDAYRYTHDAWNRLVKVEFVDNVGGVGGSEDIGIRGEYEYNGLHQRVVRRLDTNDPPNNALDQQRNIFYDASWRVCKEEIWDEWTSGSPGSIDRYVHYTWGMRYIDELLFRRIDDDGNSVYEDEHYHLYDVQFSSRIVINPAAEIVEWVDYTPYGTARHHHKWDVDADGDFDSTDRTIVSALATGGVYPENPTDIDETGYRAEADLNRDGTIDSTDNNLVSGQSDVAAISAGLISEPGSVTDNQIGYDGYCFNAETMQYAVRYRVYDPALGRWLQRDPLTYIDSMNLYESFAGNPGRYSDPNGSKLVAEGSREFVHKVERALELLCPEVDRKQMGRDRSTDSDFHIDKPDGGYGPTRYETKRRMRSEALKRQGRDCDYVPNEECSERPGCDLLECLINSPNTHTIREAEGDEVDRNKPVDGGGTLTIWRGEEVTRKGMPEDYLFGWVLYHELTHACGSEEGTRDWTETAPGEYGWEEVRTVEKMNKLREWWNKCGKKSLNQEDKDVTMRDPYGGHPWSKDLKGQKPPWEP